MSKDDVEVELKRLAEGLEEKRKAAIEKMGAKWILHPDHFVKRKEDVKPNILG